MADEKKNKNGSPANTPESENGNGKEGNESKKAAKEKEEREEKIKSLKSKLQKKEKKISDLEEDLKWKQADFENYRKSIEKRMNKERLQMQAKIYKDFLPFFDAFDKAIENNTALLEKYGDLPQEVQKYLSGIQGLYKNMNGILESKDLARMNVVGKPFDYNYHDVIMKIEDADVEEDTVVREVQKGWLLDGKVLRPAGVAVAKHPPKKEEASKDGEGNDGKERKEDTSGNSDAGGEEEEKQ